MNYRFAPNIKATSFLDISLGELNFRTPKVILPSESNVKKVDLSAQRNEKNKRTERGGAESLF